MSSELDIYSDSDWLEISSGRDSDDNVSLSDQDSDHEIGSANRSRRSSFSAGSTGEVDAWEGFVSDSAEEAVSPLNGMYTVPLTSSLGSEPIALGFIPQASDTDASATVDKSIVEEEEKRVKQALDQSFIGTLSASRSTTAPPGTASLHSSSAHSIRDLRLSFPDPLTSSHNELNRSYEAVSSSAKTAVPAPALFSSPVDEIDEDAPVESTESSTISIISTTSASIPPSDLGSLPPTPEVQRSEDREPLDEGKPELDIILYGTSSEIKWRFVQELIHTATKASGHDILNSLHEGESVQTLRLVKKSGSQTTFFARINVHDRTGQSGLKLELDDNAPEHPSFAIVFVPTAKLPLLQWHTAFMPVLVPSGPSAEGDNTVMKQAAEDDWDLLAVPTKKVVKLGSSDSLVFDSSKLSELKPSRVYDVLYDIGHDDEDEETPKPLTEKIKSMNAVTLFGLLSIVAGFAFNTAIHPAPIVPTPTVNAPSTSSNQIWAVVSPQPNRSVLAVTSPYTHKGYSVASTLEELALSVYDAHTTSISITSQPSSMSLIVASTSKAVAEVVSTSPMPKNNHRSNVSGSNKPRSTTDVVVHSSSATALSEIPQLKTSLSVVTSSTKTLSQVASTSSQASCSTSTGSSSAKPSSSSTSSNFKHVSNAFDVTTKVINEVVNNDLNELIGAADELLATILTQTESVIRQSKGKARAMLGEQIQNVQNLNEGVVARNEKAKQRAKDIKAKGHQMMKGAKEELLERTERAKKRARELKQSVVESGSEAWKTYEKAHEEWEGVLLGKSVNNGGKREERRAYRRGRRDERKEKMAERRDMRKHSKQERHARADKENVRQPGLGWRGFV
ncbi:hypothetical protein CPB83DRAFT_847066 [Crepidotus variabilis]|uniref:Uncharacterized protein n=1 Tax=Crepidotus variabilis TaxID=179855 RepID=A0A9P6EP69_9AGAR|nr:hypothetical protein CPB83DRAFT_847066 [Crepidotus variabilis]